MNPFIHTFSIVVNITGEELGILLKRYRWIDLKKSYKGDYYNYSIIEFCKNGLQMQIRKRIEEEVTYDKKHDQFQMELVVTPYKLLHPGSYYDCGRYGKSTNYIRENIRANKNGYGNKSCFGCKQYTKI